MERLDKMQKGLERLTLLTQAPVDDSTSTTASVLTHTGVNAMMSSSLYSFCIVFNSLQ